MPPKEYTNLSLIGKELNHLKRAFTMVKTDKTFTKWCVFMLNRAADREIFLQNNWKHLQFVKSIDFGFVIFDAKIKNAVVVEVKKDRLTCSIHHDQPCEHQVYAALNPNLTITQN